MKVAFAGSFAARIADPVRERLSLACQFVVDETTANITDRLHDVDVLVSMEFSPCMAKAAPRLRLVQVPGTGLDRIDRTALRSDTWLANAYGHEVGIAEYIIGTMLALTRSFAGLDHALRQGRWESQWAVGITAPPPWSELAGKTLGVLGFGHIGQALARRAVAFDMRLYAVRRSARRDPPNHLVRIVGPEHIDDVLRQSDYIAITLPLSSETLGLIDDRRFGLLRPTAFLVNVGRAEICNEASLYQALASGRIAGAALDVWYRYPSAAGTTLPATQPFHELRNIIMTPHVSGWTEGMLAARATLIAENIARTARGEAPLNAC